jgi:hypothetical protein
MYENHEYTLNEKSDVFWGYIISIGTSDSEFPSEQVITLWLSGGILSSLLESMGAMIEVNS